MTTAGPKRSWTRRAGGPGGNGFQGLSSLANFNRPSETKRARLGKMRVTLSPEARSSGSLSTRIFMLSKMNFTR